MNVSLHSLSVLTGSGDIQGELLMVDEQLAAVVVRLEDAEHGPMRGAWFLEAGFGPCAVAGGVYFASLDEAAEWVGACVVRWRDKYEPPALAAGEG